MELGVVDYHYAVGVGISRESVCVIVRVGCRPYEKRVEFVEPVIIVLGDELAEEANIRGRLGELGQRLFVGRRKLFVLVNQNRDGIPAAVTGVYVPVPARHIVGGDGRDKREVFIANVARRHCLYVPEVPDAFLVLFKNRPEHGGGKRGEELPSKAQVCLVGALAEKYVELELLLCALRQNPVRALLYFARDVLFHLRGAEVHYGLDVRLRVVASRASQQRHVIAHVLVFEGVAEVENLELSQAGKFRIRYVFARGYHADVRHLKGPFFRLGGDYYNFHEFFIV